MYTYLLNLSEILNVIQHLIHNNIGLIRYIDTIFMMYYKNKNIEHIIIAYNLRLKLYSNVSLICR